MSGTGTVADGAAATAMSGLFQGPGLPTAMQPVGFGRPHELPGKRGEDSAGAKAGAQVKAKAKVKAGAKPPADGKPKDPKVPQHDLVMHATSML